MGLNYNEHISHCCKWHGCKYGDFNCPVVTGKVKQEYLCEDCYDTIAEEEYYRQILQDIEEMKQFKENKKKILGRYSI